MQSDIEAIILLHRLLDNVSSFITFCGLPIYSLYVPNCWGPFRVSINVRRQRRPAMCLYSLLITFYFFFPIFQLRVTAARPGVVNFELDIKKEHTVSYPLWTFSWELFTMRIVLGCRWCTCYLFYIILFKSIWELWIPPEDVIYREMCYSCHSLFLGRHWRQHPQRHHHMVDSNWLIFHFL